MPGGISVPRGTGLAKTTARLAVVGIALGVASMIFAQALSRGFREDVQEKLLTHTAHISVGRADGGGLDDCQELKKELSNIDGVKRRSGRGLQKRF